MKPWERQYATEEAPPWKKQYELSASLPWRKVQAEEAAERRKTAPHLGKELTRQTAEQEVAEHDYNPATKLFLGANQAWGRSAYGLKDFFTNLTPEEQNRYETGKASVDAMGGWGTGGEIAGDVALTAPAFGRAIKFVAGRGLPKTMSRFGQGAASAGIGGVTGGLLTPEDRLESAGYGAAGGAAGELVGPLISKGIVKLGKGGQRATDLGIEPTLGDILKEGGPTQRRAGEYIRRAENLGVKAPVVRNVLPVTHARNKAYGKAQTRLAAIDNELDDLSQMSEQQMQHLLDEKQMLENLVSSPTEPASWLPSWKTLKEVGTFAAGGAGSHYLAPGATEATGLAAGAGITALNLFPKTMAMIATGRTPTQRAFQKSPGVGLALPLAIRRLYEDDEGQ